MYDGRSDFHILISNTACVKRAPFMYERHFPEIEIQKMGLFVILDDEADDGKKSVCGRAE